MSKVEPHVLGDTDDPIEIARNIIRLKWSGFLFYKDGKVKVFEQHGAMHYYGENDGR